MELYHFLMMLEASGTKRILHYTDDHTSATVTVGKQIWVFDGNGSLRGIIEE